MKSLYSISFVLLCLLACASCSTQSHEESMEQLIERGLQTATEQSLLMAKELESQEGML